MIYKRDSDRWASPTFDDDEDVVNLASLEKQIRELVERVTELEKGTKC